MKTKRSRNEGQHVDKSTPRRIALPSLPVYDYTSLKLCD